MRKNILYWLEDENFSNPTYEIVDDNPYDWVHDYVHDFYIKRVSDGWDNKYKKQLKIVIDVNSNEQIFEVIDDGSENWSKKVSVDEFSSNMKLSLMCGNQILISKDIPFSPNEWNNIEYVDLDLPSGTVWAKMDVCATEEYLPGLYYRWGDPDGITSDQIKAGNPACILDNYKYYDTTTGLYTKYVTLSSYGTPDNLTELQYSDDPARVNMGGKWRLPTMDQVNELQRNCNIEYISNYNNTGKCVRKYSSKLDASKFIVMPMGGFGDNTSVTNLDEPSNTGTKTGYYYTRTLNVDNNGSAYMLGCYQSNAIIDSRAIQRRYGFNCRGVLNKNEFKH